MSQNSLNFKTVNINNTFIKQFIYLLHVLSIFTILKLRLFLF